MRRAQYSKVDEIPFDFSRKIMSVVVETPEERNRLICKGAPEEVFSRCTQFELDGEFYPDGAIFIEDLHEEYDELSPTASACWRWPTGTWNAKPAYSKDDEADLILKGYVAFLDPPKETAAVGHRGPARARRRGQGADRRQRPGEPQDLPGGRHSPSTRCCWAARWRR